MRRHIVIKAAGSFALQVGFAGFSFFNAIILARVLGTDGYGAFANAMAWVSLLTIPATFGFGILLVRDTAISRSKKKWSLLKGLLRFSDLFVFFLSVVLAFIAAGAAGWVFSSPEQTLMRETVWIALLLLPLLALSKLREAGGRGLEHVICASFPGMIIRPALLLAGVWGIYFFKPEHLSASVAMIINIIAATAAFGCSIFLFRSLLPKEYKVSSVEYAPKIWLKDAFPMLIYGGAQIVMAQTDIIMIGVIQQAHDVGLYAGASRLAFLVAYTIIAAETIIAPIIARLYADSKKKRLQKNLTQTVRIAFLTTLPLGLLLTIAGEKILMIFGSGFIHAKTALVILTVGRLLHVALGPGPLLLSMTGYEKIVARILSVAVFVNIIGNIVLIPHYGINGAAITSAVSIIFARYATSKYAALRTGLYVTVIGARHD